MSASQHVWWSLLLSGTSGVYDDIKILAVEGNNAEATNLICTAATSVICNILVMHWEWYNINMDWKLPGWITQNVGKKPKTSK